MIQLRFLKGNWEFGVFKLQYLDEAERWIDVPTINYDPKPSPAPCVHVPHTVHDLWHKGKFTVTKCEKCGIVMDNPEPDRVWCSHIYSQGGLWWFKTATNDVCATGWDNCPLCPAKRPAEKPRTLAERITEAGRKYTVDAGFILPNKKVEREDEFFGAIATETVKWFREKVESLPKERGGWIQEDALLRAIE